MEKGNKRPDQSHRLRSRGRWRALLTATVALLFVSPFPFTRFPGFFQSHAAHIEAAIVSTATREGRLAVFDDAWATINERYYDRSFHGLDWDAQRIVFRSRAAETNSGTELYAVMRQMIASLNDPHTRVFAPEETFDWWNPRFVSIGLAMREVEGLPTVVQVERSSAPQRAGIRAGDVIETVDGEPSLSLVNSRLDESLTASRSSRYRAFATMLEGRSETSVEIRWQGMDGKERSARFERHWQQRYLGLRVRRERGKYAVFEIDAFTNSIAYGFANLVKEKLKGIHGIIIDLRGNGGGDADAMADVASAFLAEGYSLGQFSDRFGASFILSTRSKSLLMPERIAQTKLPLIVLTSERTSSAAEIFIAALKTSRRARIIGTETCGCVLAIRTRHTLPDGGLLDISELDYHTSEGDRLEEHGIKPDETVAVERADLYSGRDRAMELAISELVRGLGNQRY